MTTEVSIMNMHAVALAADSAVTIRTGNGSDQKIFNSVNKLFTLSKYHPVGVMIYGAASYMRLPWETIIKVYRKKLGSNKKKSVEEYAKDFINYVSGLTEDEQDISQEERAHIIGFFNHLKDKVISEIKVAMEEGSIKSESELNENLERLFELKLSVVEEEIRCSKKAMPDGKTSAINKIKACSFSVDEIWNDVFGEMQISECLKSHAYEVCAKGAESEIFYTSNSSGIVIAGFGDDEFYPAQVSFEIEGYIFGFLKLKNYSVTKIGSNERAVITPFAQGDVIANFMQGVDPVLFSGIKETFQSIGEEIYPSLIESILLDKGVDVAIVESVVDSLRSNGSAQTAEIIQKLDLHSRQWHVDPILDAVGFLPKEELAQLAESLVNLTSVRRRMSTNAETVGGPVDVAVISKGDGFIWINRKHYFDPALNDHFFKNYYRG